MAERLFLRREKKYSALNAGQKTLSLGILDCTLPIPLHAVVFKGEILQSLQEAGLQWSCSLLCVFPHEQGNSGFLNSSGICQLCF